MKKKPAGKTPPGKKNAKATSREPIKVGGTGGGGKGTSLDTRGKPKK
jgi:hypothetical protein